MVINKLLHGMDANPNNLKLTGLDVGSSAHADDIRACCTGVEALNRQAADINQFKLPQNKYVHQFLFTYHANHC